MKQKWNQWLVLSVLAGTFALQGAYAQEEETVDTEETTDEEGNSSGNSVSVNYIKGPVTGATAVLVNENDEIVAGPVTTIDGQASFTDVISAGF